MRKYLSSILAAALVGFAFSACTKESEIEIVDNSAKTFKMSFSAEVVDPSTKATLTPKDESETSFAAAWEVGDKIKWGTGNGVNYLAEWDGNSFVAEVPESLRGTTVGISVEYPADPTTLHRTQTGSKLNSIYDKMSGSLDNVTLSEDTRFVVPMHRNTPILYFHLKCNEDVAIDSAYLTYSTEGPIDETIRTKYYDLSSSDAILWFNPTLPGDYAVNLKVVAKDGRIFTLSSKGKSLKYEAGKLYKISKDIVWKDPETPTPPVPTTASWVAADQGYNNAEQYTSATVDSNISLAFGDGGNDGKYYVTGAGIRIYSNGKVTVSAADGATISEVVLTFSAEDYTGTFSSSTGEYSVSSKTGTWAGSARSVVFTNTAASGHARIQKIDVTYIAGNAVPTTYNVHVDDKIPGGSISADPTSAIEGAEVTLTANPADGYEFVSWNVTGVTVADATSATTTFTMPAADVDVSAVFNVKQIPTFASLEELVAADLTSGTEVTVSFENVPIKEIYVTNNGYRNGIYFDIQKGGKDIELYFQNVPASWVAGGTVSGTLTKCPWKLYNGTWELAPASGWSWSNLEYTAPVVLAAPAITTQPSDAIYILNESSKNLTVVASGNPNPTYQWYSNTTNSNENGTVLTGETSTSYKPSTNAVGTFYYYCVATNSEGSATSSVAIIKVNEPTVASLPFSFDGGREVINSTDGMSQTGLGADYSSSPKLKFDSAGDNVIINFKEAAKKVTYSIKGNGTSGTYAFDVMESADGIEYTTLHSHSSITDTKTYTDNLASTTRFVKFVYTTKASGNVALGNISISNEVDPTKYTLTIDSVTNGSISATVDGQTVVSGAKIEEGKTVTITANPESADYEFDSWSVTGASVGTLSTETFTMSSDVTVGASFKKKETSSPDPSSDTHVYTYTFNSKSWGAKVSIDGGTETNANWTGTVDGNQYNSTGSPLGVQVTTGAGSGATVTSPITFSNVTKVEVIYASSSKGVGSIAVSVGDRSVGSHSIDKSQTNTTLTYTPGSSLNGQVVLTPTVNTNSLGIKQVIVYAD